MSQSEIYERLIQASSEKRRVMKELMKEYIDAKEISEKEQSSYDTYQRLIHTATEKRVLLEEFVHIAEKVTEVEIMRYYECLAENQAINKKEDEYLVEKINEHLRKGIERDMKSLEILRKYIHHTIEESIILDKLHVEPPKKKSFWSWFSRT